MEKRKSDLTDAHVGRRVRMKRMMLGMTQEKLGAGLGITFQQVQKYEKGTNRMSASRLQHVASILRVPVSFFFEELPPQVAGDGKNSSSTYTSNFLSRADGLALAKAFTGLKDPKVRRAIVSLVEELAGDNEQAA